ncbi:MAG TPA: sel1 repeat family protein [Sneathiellales bacterium]|nr:sel1 repeat family protein [Sneathiellales bacterium]
MCSAMTSRCAIRSPLWAAPSRRSLRSASHSALSITGPAWTPPNPGLSTGLSANRCAQVQPSLDSPAARKQTLGMRMFQFLITLIVVLLTATPARADFDAGMAAYEQGDFNNAMTEWLPLAEAGDAEAQYRVGRLYGFGEGIEEDKSEALSWYRLAANQDHPIATYNLGVFYEHGYGISSDKQVAFEYFRKAAELGDITSASIVGGAHWLGKGVPEDKEEAVRWLRIAAEGGHDIAQNNLGIAYTSGEGVAKDEQKAVYWFRRSAEQGYEDAQGALGVRYKFGEGVEKDLVEAYKWHLLSHRPGNWRSYYSLATGWFMTTAAQREEATRLADGLGLQLDPGTLDAAENPA